LELCGQGFLQQDYMIAPMTDKQVMHEDPDRLYVRIVQSLQDIRQGPTDGMAPQLDWYAREFANLI
jgi:hypothetical protein